MWRIDTISGRRKRKTVAVYFLTLLIAVYLLWPLAWMALSSVQKERILQSRPPRVVLTRDMVTWNHYKFLFTGEMPTDATIMIQAMYTASGTHVLPSIGNSVLVSLVVTAANLILGVPAAHAFARIRFRGSHTLFLAVFATRMLPAIALVVPMFIIVTRLGLLDTTLSLMVIYLATSLPFTLWLLRGYFAGVPVELEEAARIDGAGRWKVLGRIVLPLARPGLIAAAVFAFMLAYGEFVFALVLTQTLASKTMPVVVASLATGLSGSRGMIAASAVLSFVPPLVVGLVFRKQLIDGLTQRFG